MKEEIKRIMKLVQEGKLSPEDAAELIDAFQASPGEEPGSPQAGSTEEGSTDRSESETGGAVKDPIRGFVDFMENIGREVSQSVDWNDVARQLREGSKKGMDALRKGVEKVKEGKLKWTWFSMTETREITLPLIVPQGKSLRIENPCGDVRVTGGATKGQVLAEVRVRGADEEEARENADAYTLLVEEGDHQVLIRQHDVPYIELNLDVRVAGTADVEVKSVAGSVAVHGTGGACKVQSQSGDVSLMGLNGMIEVTSQSGDVRVSESDTPALTLENKSGDVHLTKVTGNVNVRTASGDVTMQECMGKTVSVESVSGDVAIDLREPITGTVNVRTVNGRSTLAIADGSDCRVALSTLRGDVLCDVPLEDEARQEQHVTGRLGGGTGTVDVSAVNGDVRMRLREHLATAAG
jgi:hypothetical protein